MREILFRGKPLGNLHGKFIYGSLGVIDTDLCAIYHCFEFEDDKMQLVDVETVGQYTGLTDKNGEKIFEGYIVTYEDAEADYEGYHDNVFLNCGEVVISAWTGIGFTNRQTVEMDDLYISETKVDCEVIGNIYDNPELLEAQK